MKNVINLLFVVVILFGCSSTKDSRSGEEKDLRSSLKMLDKDPENSELKKTVSALYSTSVKNHLDKIGVLNTLPDAGKWDKIIKEYQSLQSLSETVNSFIEGSHLLKPLSYTTEILQAKESGAKVYYALGDKYLLSGDKESARKAYFSFKKSIEYQPGFKDAKTKMNNAFENGIINVVIGPVEDNMFYFGGPGFSNYGNNYSNEYFQRSLVRDLGGSYSKLNGALFYTEWDAKRENIQPDWIVELRWADINIPPPAISRDTRNVSKQVESSRDTAGHILFKTIQATLYIDKSYFIASGDMEVKVTDLNTRRIVLDNRYNGQFRWEEQSATYSGDYGALSSNDIRMVQNSNYRTPSQQDVLAQLYQKVYPQVKNRLYSLARW